LARSSIESGNVTGSAEQDSSRPRVEVALAAVRHEQLWLVSRRRTQDAFDGLWELPGGRIELGESPAEAAVRECREELSIVVKPSRVLATIDHEYPDLPIRLHVVLCRHLAGEPIPGTPAVAEARWVDGPTLAGLDMPAANKALLPALLAVGE
jgi:mutator protein MutT